MATENVNNKLIFKNDLIEACENNNTRKLTELFHNDKQFIKNFDHFLNELILETEMCTAFTEKLICLPCEVGFINVIKILNEQNFSYKLRTHKGYPIQIACKYGHLSIVKYLMEQVGIKCNKLDGVEAPVAICVINGHFDILEYLVSQSICIETESIPPLVCYAAINGHPQILEFLIEKLHCGLDLVMEATTGKFSLLELACITKQHSVIKYLIDRGAVVTKETVDNHPLSIAKVLGEKITKEDNKEDGYTANWDGLKLQYIPEQSFYHLVSLVSVSISDAELTLINDVLFLLPNVKLIDLSSNQLRLLSNEDLHWKCSNLEKLDLSKNLLESIPSSVFERLPNLETLNLSYNKLSDNIHPTTNKDNWKLAKLKTFDLSKNQLTQLPDRFGEMHNLRTLKLQENFITHIPNSLIKSSQKLESLNLLDNKIKDLPLDMHISWQTSLRELDLSRNKLEVIPDSLCQLKNLNYLTLSNNDIKYFPSTVIWTTNALQKLDLSFNKLKFRISTEKSQKGSQRIFTTRSKQNIGYIKTASTEETLNENIKELPIELWAKCLMNLNLSHNDISILPGYIGGLESLTILNLNNNKNLSELPPTLSKLKDCIHLSIEHTKIQLPATVNTEKQGLSKTKAILNYLHTELRNCVQCNQMKLMVVGLEKQGKTSLLNALYPQGKTTEHKVSTDGINIKKFKLSRNKQTIEFSSWDLAGQEVYYATHQCFLTHNTLYLVVFNMTKGEEGILELQPWLLNIQARAPNSQVVVVGTHLDQMEDQSEDKQEEIMKQILRLYQTGRQPSLYPKIVAIDFVSCTIMINISRLTTKIIDSAIGCINPITREKVIGQMIPKSYLDLQNLLQKEVQSRRDRDETLVLKYNDMLAIVQGISESELQNKKELDQAAQFLHNSGYILHYSDMIGSLSDLYFIDPTWVVDMFSQIISVKEKQSFVKQGIISEKEIKFLFDKSKNKYLSEKYINEYLFIMEKFEILSDIGGGRFLVPSMLQTNKPDNLFFKNKTQSGEDFDTVKNVEPEKEGYIVTEQGKVLRRRINFSFIPSGFWNRLISRILINIKRKFYPDNLPIETPDEKNQGLHYWKRGIAMINNECNFIIESISYLGINDIAGVQAGDLYKKNKYLLEGFEVEGSIQLPGVDIIVYSETKDFSWLGFLVDELESLLSEWFPGLEGSDIYGESNVKRYIPWKIPPIIAVTLSAESMHECIEKINEEYFYMFSYEECVRTLVQKPNIICEALNTEIPLEFLIPEISLGDLHPDFKLNTNTLIFDRSHIIGEGATANVYRGTYGYRNVAVKELNIQQEDTHDQTRRKAMHGSLESIQHYLRLIRNELQFLCKFQHPFIVELIGASIRPMLIVLELAPENSLSETLSAKAEERHTEWTQKYNAAAPPPMRGGVLGHIMTVRIALQIILAIDYLHYKRIIYRDLKSQNVLLFSLSPYDLVNVKLSDYAISLVAQPTFNKGQEGTPGFMPAEGIVKKNEENIITNKVDIFAYGMVLYELITGRYPYYPKSYVQDINKSVLNGQSPDIYSQNRKPCFPTLISLMENCWEMVPSKRPTSKDIIKQLIDPSFFMIRNSFTKITNDFIDNVEKIAGIPVQNSGRNSKLRTDYLCVWGSNNNAKRCCLIDAETSKKMDISLPTDGKVLAMCVVLDEEITPRVWISIRQEREAKTAFYRSIEVYGQLFKEGPYTCLWRYKTLDTVLCLKYDMLDGKPVVFAALLSGHIITFGRKIDFHLIKLFSFIQPDHCKCVVEVTANECMAWSVSHTVHIGNGPVTSIVKCSDEELWCACGSHIDIINRRNRNTIYRIEMFKKDENITFHQLEYYENHVYAILSKGDNSKVIIVDVNSRAINGYLLCNEIDPYQLSIFQAILTEEETVTLPLNYGQLKTKNNVETQTNLIKDRCTLIPNSIGLRKFSKINHQFPHRDIISRQSCFDRRNYTLTDRQPTRLRTIHIEKGLLWIARALGDILVVNINMKSPNYSQVVARLKAPYNDTTCYDGRSQSLMCKVQCNYIVNFQDRELGVNTGDAKERHQSIHFDVWEIMSLEELEQIHCQNEKIMSMHNQTLNTNAY